MTLPLYVLALCWRPSSILFSNLVVMIAALLIGAGISSLLSTSGAVLSFAVTAAVVDVNSFSGGLTQHIIETSNDGTSSLLRFLSLQ